jgi:hypothetical protein
MSALLRRLMYFLGRSRHDADLRDEIESHRVHRQDVRDAWVSRAVDQLWQDIRIAVRGLRKTYPVCAEIKARENDLFDGAFAWANERFDMSRGGQSAFVDGAHVSGRFFEVLVVSAVRGRMLTPADDAAAAPDGPVAVISHRFWREQFAGADDVIGRQITLQRRAFTVVGVMPPGFFGVDVGWMTDVMLPFAAEPLMRGQESQLASVGSSLLNMIVRRKLGQRLEQANAFRGRGRCAGGRGSAGGLVAGAARRTA